MGGLWEGDHYRFFSDGWDVGVVLEMGTYRMATGLMCFRFRKMRSSQTFVCDGSGNVLD